MATFTCTAYGGYYTEIEFVWSAEDLQNYSISTFEYVNSVDYSTTSIVTMTIHSANNRRSQYSCCVHYNHYYDYYYYYYYQSSFDENCETATINIGKKVNAVRSIRLAQSPTYYNVCHHELGTVAYCLFHSASHSPKPTEHHWTAHRTKY